MFDTLCFLRTFRIREDRRVGCCRGGRDHRSFGETNDMQMTSCKARTGREDDGLRVWESTGS